MRIGELARRSGLAPSAIRYYEREDMFSSGQIDRGSNGYRDYSIDALRRLELIRAGRAAGFSLTQMRTQMSDCEHQDDAERTATLENQLQVIEVKIAELELARADVTDALRTLRGS